MTITQIAVVVGFVVLAYVYRGDRARNLALAGLAMGETPETAAAEPASASGLGS